MELNTMLEYKVRRMSSRNFLAFIFRLSIVAGVGSGLFDAYQTFRDWDEERIIYVRNKMRMECAAKISDDWLTRNTNEFGNMDVALICGSGADGKTFFVNIGEIKATRRGEDIYVKSLWRKPYDIIKSMVMVTAATVGINLIGAFILGLFIVGRWIAFGGRRQQ
jgi:hypothetical protein